MASHSGRKMATEDHSSRTKRIYGDRITIKSRKITHRPIIFTLPKVDEVGPAQLANGFTRKDSAGHSRTKNSELRYSSKRSKTGVGKGNAASESFNASLGVERLEVSVQQSVKDQHGTTGSPATNKRSALRERNVASDTAEVTGESDVNCPPTGSSENPSVEKNLTSAASNKSRRSSELSRLLQPVFKKSVAAAAITAVAVNDEERNLSVRSSSRRSKKLLCSEVNESCENVTTDPLSEQRKAGKSSSVSGKQSRPLAKTPLGTKTNENNQTVMVKDNCAPAAAKGTTKSVDRIKRSNGAAIAAVKANAVASWNAGRGVADRETVSNEKLHENANSVMVIEPVLRDSQNPVSKHTSEMHRRQSSKHTSIVPSTPAAQSEGPSLTEESSIGKHVDRPGKKTVITKEKRYSMRSKAIFVTPVNERLVVSDGAAVPDMLPSQVVQSISAGSEPGQVLTVTNADIPDTEMLDSDNDICHSKPCGANTHAQQVHNLRGGSSTSVVLHPVDTEMPAAVVHSSVISINNKVSFVAQAGVTQVTSKRRKNKKRRISSDDDDDDNNHAERVVETRKAKRSRTKVSGISEMDALRPVIQSTMEQIISSMNAEKRVKKCLRELADRTVSSLVEQKDTWCTSVQLQNSLRKIELKNQQVRQQLLEMQKELAQAERDLSETKDKLMQTKSLLDIGQYLDTLHRAF